MIHTRQLLWMMLLAGQSLLLGQNFLSTVKEDSVFIFLTETPAVGQSVIVECQGPEDSDFIQLNQDPIRPVLSSDEALRMLGKDYQDIADAMQAENIQQTLFLLRNDPFYGGVFTMLNRNVGRLLGRFFAAGGHEKNAVYRYRIRMIDRRGNTQKTFEKKIQIIEKQPVPPEQITLTSQPLGMEISWKYPPWNRDSDDLTVQFYLYRRINDSFQLIKDHLLRLEMTDMSFLDRHVQQGDSVCYYLIAVDAAGLMSAPSEMYCGRFIDTVPPSQPLGLSTKLQEGHVTLIWNLNPELDVASYNVYRASTMTSPLIRINMDPVQAEDPWYTDNTCQPRSQYFYAVTAVDASGNESPAGNRISIWIEDRNPPPPPRNVQSHVENRQVRLNWQPALASDIQGYRIYRGFTEKTLYRLTETLTQDTVCVDGMTESLEPGRHYYYVITAVDSSWLESENTAIWVTIPDDKAPRQPGDVRSVVRTGDMLIQWNPSTSSDVVTYKLTKICKGTTIELGEFPASVFEWADTTVIKGETCQYSITAVDTAGNQSPAALSAPVMMRDFEPPHCPRFLQARAEKTGVTIQWERITAADLTGYLLYRAEIETGLYQQITETPLSVLRYHDTEGKSHHWYRVKAIDSSGNESEFSQSVPAIVSTE